MKIVIEIDPARQEFSGLDAEGIILRRLRLARDGEIQVQGFTATVVGVVVDHTEADRTCGEIVVKPLEAS